MLKDIKVALIGHTLPEPVEINFPKNPMKAKALLSLHNFTRVVTKDNKLFDHVAYLKKKAKNSKRRNIFFMGNEFMCWPPINFYVEKQWN